MVTHPCILIVIVNYRSTNLTIDCLHSLVTEVQTFRSIKVVVVDNTSGDDSVERLETTIQSEGWQSWVSVLASPENGGYAYGNNLAIRPALASRTPPDYIFLLNPDTRVEVGAIQVLGDFMEEHLDVGIAGSGLKNADGTPWPIAFRFPNLLGELDSGLRLGIVSKLLNTWIVPRVMSDKTELVDWVPGASMMIRRQVFESVGLMDEGYFLYYEETDFCLQAKRAGWSCWYVPQSQVTHIAGQSTGVTVRNVKPTRLPKYWFDSRKRYFLKNHGLLYTMMADFCWILGYSSWRGRRILQRKPDLDPPSFLGDFIRNSVFFSRD